MELNVFIKKFVLQFDEIEAEKINAETKFRDIEEWSSLMALSIIAMVDEEYNVKIKGEDIRNSHTIRDIYDIVNSRL